jgi:hypothetical protein
MKYHRLWSKRWYSIQWLLRLYDLIHKQCTVYVYIDYIIYYKRNTLLRVYHLRHKQYAVYTYLSILREMFVKVNTENHRKRIFNEFTHLITDSHSLTVCFFFIPATNLDDIWSSSKNLVMANICSQVGRMGHNNLDQSFNDFNELNHVNLHLWQDWNTRSNSRNSQKYMSVFNCQLSFPHWTEVLWMLGAIMMNWSFNHHLLRQK